MAVTLYRFTNELEKTDLDPSRIGEAVRGGVEGFKAEYVKGGIYWDAVIPIALILIGILGIAGVLPGSLGGWCMGMGLGFAVTTVIMSYFVTRAARHIDQQIHQPSSDRA